MFIQTYLTTLWNRRIPRVLRRSAAEVAAAVIIDNLPDFSTYTFVDLCAGAGGPIPTIEKVLNEECSTNSYIDRQSEEGLRDQNHLGPIKFILADLIPCQKGWEKLALQENIICVPKEVDVTQRGGVDVTTLEGVDGITLAGALDNRRECRMFNISFHHFDDDSARNVLANAMESTQAFM